MPNHSSANDNLHAALGYAGRGWHVLPCHSIQDGRCTCGNPECSSPGKHPRTRTGLKESTVDEATIRRWWTEWPDANVAIRTGSESGIVVLDVDKDHDGFESLERLGMDMSGVPSVTTGGGGRHYYFASSGHLKNRVGILPGIDFRGENGYVLAPPSNHISGSRYEWEHGEPTDFPAIPPELADLLEDKSGDPSNAALQGTGPAPIGPHPDLISRAMQYVAKCGPAVEGNRNSTAFRIAGNLAALDEGGTRLTGEEILDIIRPWNRQCSPPLPEQELSRAIESAMKNGTPREVKPSTTSPVSIGAGPADTWPEFVPFDEEAGLPEFPVDVLPSVLQDWVVATAEALQVPNSLPALLALVAVATPVSRHVRVKAWDGWEEPTKSLCCHRPGPRKSQERRI